MKARPTILGWTILALCAGAGCSHEKQVQKTPETPPVVEEKPAPAPPPAAPAPAPVADEGGDAIYFDFDAAVVRDDARPTLQKLAEKLKANPGAKVRIEGNCDERGTDEYNLALGSHRAEAAKRYLESLGVPAGRIATVSFGSERPKFQGHDESSWSKNRRDDFVTR